MTRNGRVSQPQFTRSVRSELTVEGRWTVLPRLWRPPEPEAARRCGSSPPNSENQKPSNAPQQLQPPPSSLLPPVGYYPTF